MSILIDRHTRVAVQGITGKFGVCHTERMQDYGTEVVAGVTPGKGGANVRGVPVFDTLREAQQQHPADAVLSFVPGPFLKDAILEAMDEGMKLIVAPVEGMPVRDMVIVSQVQKQTGTLIIGPNTPGIITPGECVIGFLPGEIYSKGSVGVASRSGTFSLHIADLLTQAGLGQSTVLGIGGDPITGVSIIEILERFALDPDTRVIVFIGEIGGTTEEEAAEYIAAHVSKPVISIVAGRTAPAGKTMGHAGAIIAGGKGSYASKITALERAGVRLAQTGREVVGLVKEALGGQE